MGQEKNTSGDNFIQIWERIQYECKIKTMTQLSEIIGVSQSCVSKKKGKNIFPHEWVEIISKKYNLLTEWILTGEGKKRTEDDGKEKILRNKFLLQVADWLEDIAQRDPRKEIWFEIHFEKSFPEFKNWILKQRLAEGDQHRRAV